jgi:hypothetical protein
LFELCLLQLNVLQFTLVDVVLQLLNGCLQLVYLVDKGLNWLRLLLDLFRLGDPQLQSQILHLAFMAVLLQLSDLTSQFLQVFNIRANWLHILDSGGIGNSQLLFQLNMLHLTFVAVLL